MMKQKITILVAILLAVFTLGAVSGAPVAAQESDTDQEDRTIMEVLRQHDRLETFVIAVQAAGLADNLDNDGPFTVFAPTDEAFTAFQAMAAEEDPEATLTDILLYHVINGNYNASEVAERDFLPTLGGERVEFNVEDGQIVLNDRANFIETEVEASNGVVYVIDTVLLPPVNALATSQLGDPSLPITQVLANDGRFDLVLQALDAAGLRQMLANPNANFTVFVPTDETLNQLPQDRLDALLADPEGELSHLLRYHIVSDTLSINQIANDDLIPTVEGRPLFVTTDAGANPSLNGNQITEFNIRAANGVIHIVEGVLTP